jgi:hypothetical protein
MNDRPEQRHPMTKAPVLYRIPGVDSVVVRRGLAYVASAEGEAGAQGRTMDVYYPPGAKNHPPDRPAGPHVPADPPRRPVGAR